MKTTPSDLSFRIAWISLAVSGVATLIFGLIVSLWPTSDLSVRATGVASIGMGFFGTLITITAFRRRERWAWFVLWYYPVFWAAHFFGRLPPGRDHVHQIVLFGVSVVGLLISVGVFFPRAVNR